MKYRDIIGYSKSEKKIIKEEVKPKSRVNKVLNNIKQELNESNVALGIQTLKDNPPFKTEKQIEEGPSYEYANHIKKIEKAENQQAKEVNNLVKLLMKKGLRGEARDLSSAYMKGAIKFDTIFKKIVRKLM